MSLLKKKKKKQPIIKSWGDRLTSDGVTALTSSLQHAPLALPERFRYLLFLFGFCHGDEPDLQVAGGERRAVFSLRLPGAQQADEAPQHQVANPQYPAAGAGAQHQPRYDPPADPQSASSDTAAGPVWSAGGGRRPRNHGDHHHNGNNA